MAGGALGTPSWIPSVMPVTRGHALRPGLPHQAPGDGALGPPGRGPGRAGPRRARSGRSPFTLLQLLRHEAGFPAWLPLYGFANDRARGPGLAPGRVPAGGRGRENRVLLPRVHPPGTPSGGDLACSAGPALRGARRGTPGPGPEEACFWPPAGLRERAAATEQGPSTRPEWRANMAHLASLPGTMGLGRGQRR